MWHVDQSLNYSGIFFFSPSTDNDCLIGVANLGSPYELIMTKH